MDLVLWTEEMLERHNKYSKDLEVPPTDAHVNTTLPRSARQLPMRRGHATEAPKHGSKASSPRHAKLEDRV